MKPITLTFQLNTICEEKQIDDKILRQTLAGFIARALTQLASTEMIIGVGEANVGEYSDSYTQFNCYQIEKII